MPGTRIDADSLEFRLLGPLQLVSGGRVVAPGGPKQRLLLAALLVDAGRVVSVDRLCDRLWPDRRPRDPEKSLHTNVSRLRRVLHDAAGPDGRDLLVTRPPGYVLTVARDRIDAGGFETDLRAAERTDDPAAALRLLDRALRRWRGPALAEFDAEFARVERQRLEEMRLVAVEERIEALLRLGGHAEVVGELETLVAEHPFRERLRGQWMRALYHGGRQTEALEGYRAFRDRLGRELGLEPGERLRRLERDILRHAAELAPAGDGLREAADGHERLPVELTRFVGRTGEAQQLVTMLEGDTRLVTVVGMGGVGKTRLAVRAAHDAAPSRMVHFCDLAPVSAAPAVATAVATSLGAHARQAATAVDTVVEFLRTRRLLLVLDNCEHVVDAVGDLVAAILQACPGVTVLATSRRPVAVEGERLLPLAPLPVRAEAPGRRWAPAVELFLDRARALRPQLTDQALDPGVVTALCERLDGLPLAIELAAARTRSMAPADILGRLEERPLLLDDQRRTTADRHRTLHAVVDWSFHLLGPDARTLFLRLSVFAGSFSLEAAERVCSGDGLPPETVADVLAALVDHSMLMRDGSGARTRYRLLETLRQYGRRALGERRELEELRRRHAAYYLDLVQQAERHLTGPDEAAWVHTVDEEFDNLRETVRFGASRGDLDVQLGVTAALHLFAASRLRDEVFRWAQQAVEAPEAPSHPLYAPVCGTAAMGCSIRGDTAGVVRYAERGLRTVPDPSDPGRGRPLVALGDVALYRGDLLRLRQLDTDSLRLAREIDDDYLETIAYLHLTLGHLYAGDRQTATRTLAELERCARRSRNPTSLAWHHYVKGEVLRSVDHDEAAACFREAIRLADAVDNRFTAGVANVSLASLEAGQGEPRRALRSFRAVIRHWRDVGDWTHQWTTMRNLVTLLARLGADRPATVLRAAVLSADTAAPPYGADADRMATLASSLRADLGEAAFAAADAQGRRMTDDEAVDYALMEIDRLARRGPATGEATSSAVTGAPRG